MAENKYEIFTTKEFSDNAYIIEKDMMGGCEVE
jgi:predicted RNase H-like HicB family nuclease